LGAAVAQALREIAALVALEPGNRFRARAYELRRRRRTATRPSAPSRWRVRSAGALRMRQ
jgi:hypothetical protein